MDVPSQRMLRPIGSRFECSLQASALRIASLSSKPVTFVVSHDVMVLWACKSTSAPYTAAYRFGYGFPEGPHMQWKLTEQAAEALRQRMPEMRGTTFPM